MNPDIRLTLRFLSPAEGGRSAAVEGQHYHCPLFVDGQGFDCRLLLDGKKLELGIEYEVPVKFLFPELALPKLEVGKEVSLWEGRTVAHGVVVNVSKS